MRKTRRAEKALKKQFKRRQEKISYNAHRAGVALTQFLDKPRLWNDLPKIGETVKLDGVYITRMTQNTISIGMQIKIEKGFITGFIPPQVFV